MTGAETSVGPMRNSGFESTNALEGWELNTYGAQPTIESDAATFHEGHQSIRLTATEPSDTALGQEVTLKGTRWYRLSGWVKTRALDPHGASTAGTFQIQKPRGSGIIAAGVNHTGDTDWTEVPVYFQTPPDGRVRVCAFFVGFGKGTGTAWFDGVTLQETDVASSPVRVTRTPLCTGEINPFQYGQFVEYLCDLVPSMWAEKLYDGGFEGLSPYKFAFLKETDFKEKPWHPSGAVNRAQCSLDRESKISGDVSQKIIIEDGAPATAGISQDGLFVERGAACEFKCWLRSEGLHGSVRVKLHHEGKVLATGEFQPAGEWKKFSVRLVPGARDVNATLTIEFRGPATLWIDNASLMPEDTVGGWRRDVVDAVRALKPGIIRFGGSALDDSNLGEFEWKDTIGDADHRRPFRAWGGLQKTGPGLEEFVQFCHTVGAEPLICVRVSKRTPQDVAEQVQYFNGAATTPLGAWRAKNGHAEPYHIKYWQIGNERQSREYEEQLAAFGRAMKEEDPAIKLLSSYPTPAVLRNAGALIDYVCPHHYSHDLAAMENNLEAVSRMIREEAPGRATKIGVTEWNTTAGDAGPRRAMLWTLANALACSRYHNLLHRHSDAVEIANRSNLINSFCSGILQTDNHRLYKTPTYYAQQLYATLAGNRPLKIESALPPNVGLDLSATLSPDGGMVVLFAVNDSPTESTRVLDFSAFGGTGQRVSVWMLADRDRAGEPDVTNSFGDPERVAVASLNFRASSPRFEHRFPALSLIVMKWKVQ